ncbi:MAG: NPXTG-anchored protein [Oscillospiraceae bacterium]|nr:NPXTG-anchored protein [Oscillospiraceae bacterium]
MNAVKKFSIILIIAILLTLPVWAFTQETNLNNVKLEFKGYAQTPVIDGKLDEYGYSKVDIQPGDISYGGNDDTLEAAAKAMQYDIYASYDENYVYMFISMENKYYNNDGSGAWDQAGVQMGLSNVGEDTNVCEFMIGRDSTTGELVITYFTQYDGADELALTSGTDYQIVPDGDRINYEFRVPVNAFYNGGKLKEGSQFTICIVLDEYNDGYIHTQISSGLSNGRNIAQFATVTLGAPIPGPTVAAPATDAAAPAPDAGTPAPAPAPAAPATTAPTTGDNALAIFAVMVIAAAGAVVFRKRLFVK